MASTVTETDFKDALSRYPSIIQKISRKPKAGSLTLEELDKFRYETALTQFDKSTGRVMDISDLKNLIEWKMHHGTFRPTLAKLVSSNSNEKLAAATKDAYEHYANHKEDIAGTLERLTKPLSGIGPAAGSLMLSIHDSKNIVFFSDELYRWLCTDGCKVPLRYTVQEFEKLFEKASDFMARIECTPVELEKAAFVFIYELDPPPEPKPKKEPSGLPRGRPALPESEKKVKKPPSGRPRGRPALPDSEKKAKKPPSGRPRGRPALPENERKTKKTPTGRPRGRPAGVATKQTENQPASVRLDGESTRKRGRPPKKDASDIEEEEEQEQEDNDSETDRKRSLSVESPINNRIKMVKTKNS